MKNEFEYKNYFNEHDDVVSRQIVANGLSICNPLVSIIMPIYNHPMFFEKSLSSVINQKCSFEYEIVIVDNNHPEFQSSNQKIVEKAANKRIRYYVNEENIGGVGNENRGIQLSRGEYITFCHDDDMLFENALEILIHSIKGCPSKDCAILGSRLVIDEYDNPVYVESEWDSIMLHGKSRYRVTMYDLLMKNYSNGCGSLYKRNNLVEIGGFCKDYIPLPDYALNVKYATLYGAYCIEEKTVKYRVSPFGDFNLAYKKVGKVNERIKKNLIETGLISSFFPSFLVKSNLMSSYYHVHVRFEKKSLSAINFLVYRLIYRCWIIVRLLIKRFKLEFTDYSKQ